MSWIKLNNIRRTVNDSALRGLSYVIILGSFLAIPACGFFRVDYAEVESERKANFYKNLDAFQKLEQMQREDLHILSVNIKREDQFNRNFEFESYATPEFIKEAIAKGYSYEKINLAQNDPELKWGFGMKKDVGLTQERYQMYKKLLLKTNINSFRYDYERPDKRRIWFYTGEYIDTGYVYMEFPPPRFFNSDRECEPIMPSQSCYVKLRKNWYLYTHRYALDQE